MDNYNKEHGHRSKHHHRDRDRDRDRHHRHHHRHRRDSSYTSPPPPPYNPPTPAPAPYAAPPVAPVTPVKEKNFKLLVDPMLVKGAKKLYRIDGVVPGEPSLSVGSLKDPRIKRWIASDTIDLPIPKFKIDKNYVGDPPELEVTISNLNDNIDKQFLTDLVTKHGEVEEVSIFYHPVTRKHSGFARVVFIEVASAANCVATLHSRSVMGKQLVVFLDPMGREWGRMIDQITGVKKEQVSLDSDEESDAVKPKEKKEISKSKPASTVNPEIVRTDPVADPVAAKSEDQGNSSPFSQKTLACNPPPAATPVPPYPPPPIVSSGPVPLPDFNRPPPPLGARTAWPVHSDWQEGNVHWRPPPPAWNNAPPPRFLSPPPSVPLATAMSVPPPTEKENPLDLDTRIELLLKGGMNGMAPPFLAMDINNDDPIETPLLEEKKPTKSRSTSVSSEEPYSPPPLPPGVDLSPSLSPAIPIIPEFSSDRYLPLSTPPSPFLSDEVYLECLLSWRLKHLSYVQLREKEATKRKKQFEADKVSEISSEEDEADFNQTKDEDRMSLSSLSSANENIQEVTIPSNPYGSYTFGEASSHHPPLPHGLDPKTSEYHHHDAWSDYSGQLYPPYGASHLPYHPLHPPPMHLPFVHYPPPIVDKPQIDSDPLSVNVDLALDRVCELITATLEKDLMKRMTEVLAFNEFEQWWEVEEKKFKEEMKEPEKVKDEVKDEPEEKKSTTDALLNAIIDSNFDGVSTGFALGFRAALPKMPSFRKKRQPSPGRGDRNSSFKEKRNESDEEEMVQLSDSETQGNEPESMMRRKKLQDSDLSSVSSISDSSDTSSANSDQESSDSDSEDEILKASKEDFLSLIDIDLLDKMREKTPEARLTPIPTEDFSDFEDAKNSDVERPASPAASKELKKYAMEALVALGLDEFVSDVKIRDGPKPAKLKPKPITPVPSTSKRPVGRPPKKKEAPKIETFQEKMEVETIPEVTITKKIDKVEESSSSSSKRKAEDSEATLSPPENLITLEHSYSRPQTAKPETKVEQKPQVASWVLDHDYSGPQKVEENASVKSTTKERKKKSEKLVSHLLDTYLKKVPRPSKVFKSRDSLQEMMTCYEFLTKGVDQEDIKYMKKAYETLLADDAQSAWLNEMHWATHPVTDTGGSKRAKGNQSGCARTQGYYKLDPVEKQKSKHHYGKNKITSESMAGSVEAKGWTAAGREARSNQRRLLTAFSAVTDSELLKFNQLKFRKKLLKFGKSEIHDWGLFAMEPIAADEMVIEYVGQKVRPFLADYREIKYQKSGIGSSYLFRIDLENIIDATYCGNLSRFINHSCNPNCYAKNITIEGEKKIVIYSKRDIKVDEEITYDYKFPFEDVKIACLCGDALCKGFLN